MNTFTVLLTDDGEQTYNYDTLTIHDGVVEWRYQNTWFAIPLHTILLIRGRDK